MKVNKIFHWLYFLMLLLPIFAIPIYAIYVRNENSTFTQEISVEQNKVVDFNQQVQNGNFESLDGWGYGTNTSYSVNDNVLTAVAIENVAGNKNVYTNVGRVYQDYKYLVRADLSCDYTTLTSILVSLNPFTPVDSINLSVSTTMTSYSYIFTSNANSNGSARLFFIFDNLNATTLNVANVNFFNLTQMFGVGNEPSVEQFNQWYTNDYYEYTLSDKQLLKGYDLTTYNDTDVGSQFTYTIYNSINRYFNYDNVFNFGDLYDWLQLNFFSGNAPIGFFIFWHYLIYFLLTSLLWLLFDVLMYVPNLIHKWLDKAS